MSGHCDFCGVLHSGSCSHPGKMKLWRLQARVEELETGLITWAERAERAECDLAAAGALLQEARETWIKVGYGASHEDVAACRDICSRIDSALAGEEK